MGTQERLWERCVTAARIRSIGLGQRCEVCPTVDVNMADTVFRKLGKIVMGRRPGADLFVHSGFPDTPWLDPCGKLLTRVSAKS